MAPLSAGELLAAYAAGTLSPVEAVAELSAAIEADPHGAFWATCLERAAGEARAAEDAWSCGAARPLEGVPIAVKDIFDTAGVATTYGSAMFAGHVPERDAEAVRRVRAAGAIVLGKTATHEFAWGFSSINDALGTVHNPRSRSAWPAARAAARPPRWRSASRRWRSARTPAARSASRVRSAAPTASSRRLGA